MRCNNCGSTDVVRADDWHFGIASAVGLISFLVSLLTGYAVGANSGFLHDVHKRNFCKSCGKPID